MQGGTATDSAGNNILFTTERTGLARGFTLGTVRVGARLVLADAAKPVFAPTARASGMLLPQHEALARLGGETDAKAATETGAAPGSAHAGGDDGVHSEEGDPRLCVGGDGVIDIDEEDDVQKVTDEEGSAGEKQPEAGALPYRPATSDPPFRKLHYAWCSAWAMPAGQRVSPWQLLHTLCCLSCALCLVLCIRLAAAQCMLLHSACCAVAGDGGAVEVVYDDSDVSEGNEKPAEGCEVGGAVARAPQGLDDDFIAFGSDSEDDDDVGKAAKDGMKKPPAVCALLPCALG